jgi:uncharacterized protein (DUF433 family)
MARKSRNPGTRAQDPRLAPAYDFHTAAKYLRLELSTLRNWSKGTANTDPVFEMDDPARQYLSFMNLVEAHILAAIRRKHGVSLPQVRRALDFVQQEYGCPRPLIEESFQTDGRFLFIQKLEQLINASKGGQLAVPELLPRLERIERDSSGIPIQLFPFTQAADATHSANDPKIVVMNPRISFGRPSVAGVATLTIFNRFRAGDSLAHLAMDYGVAPEAIDEAIRCEAAA